jgi:tetratricopeptide (TPR) repeat protein
MLGVTQGDYAVALDFFQEGLATARKLGDMWGIANLLNNLGMVEHNQGNYALARHIYEESLANRRQLGDKQGVVTSLNNLANVARDEGDYGAACSMYEKALIISQELADRKALAYLLEDLGCLAAAQSQQERALRLAGAAAALREAISAPLTPSEHGKLEHALQLPRRALGEVRASVAWHHGRAMSLEQAIEYALEKQVYA